ncbi:hypothetical protein FACS1894178_9320 [Bacteroidia bacterium]|nr:hypothetical protein FACS1894178_9320 [Bacteroidia bacterium]
MKKNHIIMLLALLFVGQIFAQQPIKSGSFQFQFQSSRDKYIENITLEGMQRIDENQSSNILILNLFPGEYNLTVQYRFHNVLQTAHQTLNIEPQKRIICTLSESNQLSFNYTIDNSSMPLMYDTQMVNAAFGAFGSMVNGMWQMSQNDANAMHQNHDNDGHHHNPPHHGNNNSQVAPPPVAITQSDFNNLYNSVKKESFEDDKLQSIKTSSNFYPYFTSDQVRQLVGLLSFDDNKLDALKYLAPKVIDRQNLPVLKDVLKSSFTREDYLDFLNTLR